MASYRAPIFAGMNSFQRNSVGGSTFAPSSTRSLDDLQNGPPSGLSPTALQGRRDVSMTPTPGPFSFSRGLASVSRPLASFARPQAPLPSGLSDVARSVPSPVTSSSGGGGGGSFGFRGQMPEYQNLQQLRDSGRVFDATPGDPSPNANPGMGSLKSFDDLNNNGSHFDEDTGEWSPDVQHLTGSHPGSNVADRFNALPKPRGFKTGGVTDPGEVVQVGEAGPELAKGNPDGSITVIPKSGLSPEARGGLRLPSGDSVQQFDDGTWLFDKSGNYVGRNTSLNPPYVFNPPGPPTMEGKSGVAPDDMPMPSGLSSTAQAANTQRSGSSVAPESVAARAPGPGTGRVGFGVQPSRYDNELTMRAELAANRGQPDLGAGQSSAANTPPGVPAPSTSGLSPTAQGQAPASPAGFSGTPADVAPAASQGLSDVAKGAVSQPNAADVSVGAPSAAAPAAASGADLGRGPAPTLGTINLGPDLHANIAPAQPPAAAPPPPKNAVSPKDLGNAKTLVDQMDQAQLPGSQDRWMRSFMKTTEGKKTLFNLKMGLATGHAAAQFEADKFNATFGEAKRQHNLVEERARDAMTAKSQHGDATLAERSRHNVAGETAAQQRAKQKEDDEVRKASAAHTGQLGRLAGLNSSGVVPDSALEHLQMMPTDALKGMLDAYEKHIIPEAKVTEGPDGVHIYQGKNMQLRGGTEHAHYSPIGKDLETGIPTHRFNHATGEVEPIPTAKPPGSPGAPQAPVKDATGYYTKR